MNGSTPTGNCSSIINDSISISCGTPTTSVLFDSHIPTLSGLEGDMWASRLLTMQASDSSSTDITFNFTATQGYNGVRCIRVAMFNCKQWGVSIQTIRLKGETGGTLDVENLSADLNLCDGLVRICISHTISFSSTVITLQFVLSPDSSWVHLAEVSFYASDTVCRSLCPVSTAATTISCTYVEYFENLSLKRLAIKLLVLDSP